MTISLFTFFCAYLPIPPERSKETHLQRRFMLVNAPTGPYRLSCGRKRHSQDGEEFNTLIKRLDVRPSPPRGCRSAPMRTKDKERPWLIFCGEDLFTRESWDPGHNGKRPPIWFDWCLAWILPISSSRLIFICDVLPLVPNAISSRSPSKGRAVLCLTSFHPPPPPPPPPKR